MVDRAHLVGSPVIKAKLLELSPREWGASSLRAEATRACSGGESYFWVSCPPATHIAAYLYLYRLSLVVKLWGLG